MKVSYNDVRAAYPSSRAQRHKIIAPYSYHVLGSLSLRLTPLCINFGLKANTVTFLAFAVVLLIQPITVLGAFNSLFFVAAGLLIHLVYILDNIDGHIARYHHSSSEVGTLLDVMVSWVQQSLFPLSLGLALYLSPPDSIYTFGVAVPPWAWIVVGIARMYACLLMIAIGRKVDAMLGAEPIGIRPGGEPLIITAKSLVELEPLFLILAVPLSAVGLLHLFYGFFGFAILGVVLIGNLRRLNAVDHAAKTDNSRSL